jgi:hypothetical protein
MLARIIQDQILEAKATKQAMDEAYDGIEKANKVLNALPAPAPLVTQEADLFGWDAPSLPGPVASEKSVPESNGFAQHPSPQEQTESIHQTPSTAQQQPMSIGGPLMSNPPAVQRHAPVFTFNKTVDTPGPYNGGGYHNRNASSGFGEVMGGSADLQSLAESIDAVPSTPSMREIDDLKSQSREADAVARDAEATHRQLVAQMTELRRLAAEAESKSRSVAEKPAKKKGMFGKSKAVDVVSN